MSELIFLGVIVVLFSITLSLTYIRFQNVSLRGWHVAEAAYRNVVETQTIRISTLENRLLAHNWEEFAHLQNIPDESAKHVYADQARMPESWGLTRDEMAMAQGASNGEDLEGTDFEGPTIG